MLWPLSWDPVPDQACDEPACCSCLKYAKLVSVGQLKFSLWGRNTSLHTGLRFNSFLFPNSSSLLYMIYAMVGLMLVISFMMKDYFVQEPYVISVLRLYDFHIAVLTCFFSWHFLFKWGEKCLHWFTKLRLVIFRAQVIIPKTWDRVTPKYFNPAMLVGCSVSKLRWEYSIVALWFWCGVFCLLVLCFKLTHYINEFTRK